MSEFVRTRTGMSICNVSRRSHAKDLRNKYANRYQRMCAPLAHLDDCTGMHYRLQLNVYKFILERYYGQHVVGMYVVCIHPDNGDSAFVDDVPHMEVEAVECTRLEWNPRI